MIFELVKDYSDALSAMPADHPKRRILRLLEKAIRRDVHFIDYHPTTLFQCAWNTCWWYDCDVVGLHYEYGRSPGISAIRSGKGTATDNRVLPHLPGRSQNEAREDSGQTSNDHKLFHLVADWQRTREVNTTNSPWLRSLRPPPVHLSSAQLAVLRGHESEVTSVVFCASGDRVISKSFDNSLRLWDVQTGAELVVLREHKGAVEHVDFSVVSNSIVSRSLNKAIRGQDEQGDGESTTLVEEEMSSRRQAYLPGGGRLTVEQQFDETVRICDVHTGTELAALRGHEGKVRSVAFSPDGNYVVSGAEDKTVRIWDARVLLRGVLCCHGDEVSSVAYSPGGDRIASASNDETVRIWNAATGEEMAVLNGHKCPVLNVSFSPNGNRIASAGGCTICIWDASTGERLASLNGHDTDVTSVAFSPDGDRVVSGSRDNTVRVWDGAFAVTLERELWRSSVDPSIRFRNKRTDLAVLRGHEGTVNAVAFSPGGDHVASGSDDGTVRIWDVATGVDLAVLRGHEHPVTSVAFCPQGNRIVSAASDIRVWDANGGAELAVLRGYEGPMLSVAFSPDGEYIVGGSVEKAISVWRSATGTEQAVLRGHQDMVTSVSFSPNGEQIVSGSKDKVVRTWDVDSRLELDHLRGHDQEVTRVSFSPSGDQILSVDESPLRQSAHVWDASTGEELSVVHSVRSATFCGADRIVGHNSAGAVKTWDASSGVELTSWEPAGSANVVAVSPEGDRVAVGCSGWKSTGENDACAQVWSVGSGAVLGVMRGHNDGVNTVAFSPDGDRIATGSWDGTVRVWDVNEGAELAVMRGHEGIAITDVVFFPAGDRIASCALDKTVRIWDAVSGEELVVLESDAVELAVSCDENRIAAHCTRVKDSDHPVRRRRRRGRIPRKHVSRERVVRVWDTHTGECLEVIEGAVDLQVIAETPTRFPLRVVSHPQEMVIVKRSSGDQPIACFPRGLKHITTHPNGRTWAGSSWNHVYILTLEGGDTP